MVEAALICVGLAGAGALLFGLACLVAAGDEGLVELGDSEPEAAAHEEVAA